MYGKRVLLLSQSCPALCKIWIRNKTTGLGRPQRPGAIESVISEGRNTCDTDLGCVTVLLDPGAMYTLAAASSDTAAASLFCGARFSEFGVCGFVNEV